MYATQKITFCCLSVSSLSLAKRMQCLLGWGEDIVLMSEVRAAKQAQAPLMRAAHALGYTCVFSDPPPSTPTSAVSPGGVSIAVKQPLAIRKLRPFPLEKWQACGRPLACVVSAAAPEVALIVLYGHHSLHPNHSSNDALLADALGE